MNEIERDGHCLDSNGGGNYQRFDLPQQNSKEDCWTECKKMKTATGCEFFQPYGICSRLFGDVADGDGQKGTFSYFCLILKEEHRGTAPQNRQIRFLEVGLAYKRAIANLKNAT